MDGLRLIAALALLGAPTAHAARTLNVLMPTAGAELPGLRVPVEIEGCRTVNLDTRLDGTALPSVWTPSPYKGRWSAWIDIPPGRGAAGPHDLVLTGLCGTKTAAARIRFSAGAATPSQIAAKVARRFMARHDPESLKWDWRPAILLHGLSSLASVTPEGEERDALIEYLRAYHRRHFEKGLPRVDWADECPSALSALSAATEFGEWYGMPSARKVADYIRGEKRNALGALNHFGTRSLLSKIYPQSIWVDSLMMYANFAVRWGEWSGDAELRDFGLSQPAIFAGKLQDPGTGLFLHAWNLKKDRPMMRSSAAWLRGNGWVAASLAEMLEAAPADHPERPAIEAILARLLHGALRLRNPNGLWDTVMNDPGYAYQEASGSALIAYGIAKSVNLGLLPPEHMASARETFAALASILERRSHGLSLPQISGDTMPYRKAGYRMIPRKRDLPFGVGALALLAAELERGAR